MNGEMIIAIILVVWLFLNMMLALYIGVRVDENTDARISVMIAIKNFVQELFSDKNWFGIVLSSIVLIVSLSVSHIDKISIWRKTLPTV